MKKLPIFRDFVRVQKKKLQGYTVVLSENHDTSEVVTIYFDKFTSNIFD